MSLKKYLKITGTTLLVAADLVIVAFAAESNFVVRSAEYKKTQVVPAPQPTSWWGEFVNKHWHSAIGNVVGESPGERRAREDRANARVWMQPFVSRLLTESAQEPVYESGGRFLEAADIALHDKDGAKNKWKHAGTALAHGTVWEPPNSKKDGLKGLEESAEDLARKAKATVKDTWDGAIKAINGDEKTDPNHPKDSTFDRLKKFFSPDAPKQ